MENGTAVHPQVRKWLASSVLQPFISEFCSRLQRSRYRASTIHCYLYCVAHFAYWARQHRLALVRMNHRATARFVTEHLPHCDCPYPVKRGKSYTRAALSHLLSTLWRSTAELLQKWKRCLDATKDSSYLFPNRGGTEMTRSNVTQRLALAVSTASTKCTSLRQRAISPHIIRHATAMHLLQSGVDITMIALWLTARGENPDTLA